MEWKDKEAQQYQQVTNMEKKYQKAKTENVTLRKTFVCKWFIKAIRKTTKRKMQKFLKGQ